MAEEEGELEVDDELIEVDVGVAVIEISRMKLVI